MKTMLVIGIGRFGKHLATRLAELGNEVMIVGDSLTSDMRGGVNAGVVTCWFNPSHAVNTGNLPIDYEIERLSQVLSLVCPPADAENRTNGEG